MTPGSLQGGIPPDAGPDRDAVPLADPGAGGGVPNDMPVAPDEDGEDAAQRPERTEERPAEPRPGDDA